MKTVRIAIIGGGLSGLYAAALLEERGITDYVVLEARDTFGGRILSAPHAKVAASLPGIDRYDLGATWFWPDMHPELHRLIEQLGLKAFRQYEAGDMLVERSRDYAPSRVDGFMSAPPALRVAGGMGALVEAILGQLPTDRLVSGRHVKRLSQREGCIAVEAQDTLGGTTKYRAERVLLAVPPRLAAATISFAPVLPASLGLQWQACATWMAPHAKYVAVFETPFWREQGLSGGARSAVGPMVEIHDASPPTGKGALFGFLGIPSQIRRQTPEAVLLSHCRAQFARLFGDKAAKPEAEFLKDWAADPLTAVAADENPEGHDALRLAGTPSDEPWRNRVIGIASEWSPNFSGYVAGAIEAAREGVQRLLAADAAPTV